MGPNFYTASLWNILIFGLKNLNYPQHENIKKDLLGSATTGTLEAAMLSLLKIKVTEGYKKFVTSLQILQ